MKLYYYVFRPHVQGVKSFVINGEKILLVRIGYAHQGWELPGGGVERAESPETAARRETLEESGIAVEKLQLVGTVEANRQYKKIHLSYFYAKTEQVDIYIDDQEIVDAGWFSVDTLPNPRREILDTEIKVYLDWERDKE